MELRTNYITYLLYTLALPPSVVKHGGCASSYTTGEPAGQCGADGGHGALRREDQSSGHDAGISSKVKKSTKSVPTPAIQALEHGARGTHI